MVSVSVLQMGKWLSRLPGLPPGEGVTQVCPWRACRWVIQGRRKDKLSPGCQAGGAEAHSSFPGHVAGLLRNCWGRSSGQGTWPEAPAWAAHRSMWLGEEWQSRDSCSRLLTQEVGGDGGTWEVGEDIPLTILSYGWVMFHCIYAPHLIYPFLHQWMFRLPPCLSYCE